MDAEIQRQRREFQRIRRDLFEDRRWARRLRDLRRLLVQHPRSLLHSLRDRRSLDGLQRLCLFIGHGRSGSTLVASLLDAHPNIVLGQEVDVLWHVGAGFQRRQILSLLRRSSRWFTERQRRWEGYSYRVPGQWQGRPGIGGVIGDKKASLTAIRLLFAPDLLDRTRKRMGLPVSLVHVVRNPYDNITTLARRWSAGRACDRERLHLAIRHYFISAEVVERARRQGERIFTLRLEELIERPRERLHALCGFLGVEASPGYLDACAGIVFRRPRRTRSLLPWDDGLIRLVRRRSLPFAYLRDYSFEDTPPQRTPAEEVAAPRRERGRVPVHEGR